MMMIIISKMYDECEHMFSRLLIDFE